MDESMTGGRDAELLMRKAADHKLSQAKFFSRAGLDGEINGELEAHQICMDCANDIATRRMLDRVLAGAGK